MWRGSAAEYRWELENEVVCLECFAKRKDLCRRPDGSVCDAHESRGRLERLRRDHDVAEDRAYQIRCELDEMRQKIREALEKRSTT